mmetsp:Transcript_23758/g.62482  ORF Transcript_23758/g.62482 Transcript_23758/m.62482 type:complete len:215 (-) Transcript_23758:67-711(-)
MHGTLLVSPQRPPLALAGPPCHRSPSPTARSAPEQCPRDQRAPTLQKASVCRHRWSLDLREEKRGGWKSSPGVQKPPRMCATIHGQDVTLDLRHLSQLLALRLLEPGSPRGPHYRSGLGPSCSTRASRTILEHPPPETRQSQRCWGNSLATGQQPELARTSPPGSARSTRALRFSLARLRHQQHVPPHAGCADCGAQSEYGHHHLHARPTRTPK